MPNRLNPRRPDRTVVVNADGMADEDLLAKAGLMVETAGLDARGAYALGEAVTQFVALRSKLVAMRGLGFSTDLMMSVEWTRPGGLDEEA